MTGLPSNWSRRPHAAAGKGNAMPSYFILAERGRLLRGDESTEFWALDGQVYMVCINPVNGYAVFRTSEKILS